MPDPESDLQEMSREVSIYFSAEKAESVVLAIAGIAALGFGTWFWTTPGYLRGIAWPLVAIGVIQLVVGTVLLLRTDRQAAKLQAILADDPSRFRSGEESRIASVMRGFRVYMAVEIVLLVAAIALVFLAKRNGFWYGVGTGLVIQSALLLALDVLAERRAEEYREVIREILGGTDEPDRDPVRQ